MATRYSAPHTHGNEYEGAHLWEPFQGSHSGQISSLLRSCFDTEGFGLLLIDMGGEGHEV